MTGEDLYVEFKAALNYLTVGFHGMKDVTVTLDRERGTIVFSSGLNTCSVKIPERK